MDSCHFDFFLFDLGDVDSKNVVSVVVVVAVVVVVEFVVVVLFDDVVFVVVAQTDTVTQPLTTCFWLVERLDKSKCVLLLMLMLAMKMLMLQ